MIDAVLLVATEDGCVLQSYERELASAAPPYVSLKRTECKARCFTAATLVDVRFCTLPAAQQSHIMPAWIQCNCQLIMLWEANGNTTACDVLADNSTIQTIHPLCMSAAQVRTYCHTCMLAVQNNYVLCMYVSLMHVLAWHPPYVDVYYINGI